METKEKNCCRQTKRDEQDKRQIIIRLNKIIGQMNGVKKMIENDRYCFDVLSQLSAIDKAIGSLSSKLIDHHLHTCVVDDIKKGYNSISYAINNNLSFLNNVKCI